jgi:uncharacterized protein YraI
MSLGTMISPLPASITGATLRALLCGAAAALTPLLADAQQAQTAKWAHVRAGPAREYPLVLQLPPNVPLQVQGCLSDYSWCDVIAPDNNRGWIWGGNLIYPYQNSGVPVLQYGATIGLPIVTFALGSYWGSYYRGRPFYRDQPRWDGWARQHRPSFRPPPPPHRPDFRPPGGPGVRPGPPPGVRPPPRPGPQRPPEGRPGPERPPGGGGMRPGPRPGGEGGGMRPGPRPGGGEGGGRPSRER